MGWLGAQFLSEDEVARAQAQKLGVPFVVLTRENIEPEALVLIPEPLSRTHSAVAYASTGGVVEVALVNMDALEKITALHPHLKIKPRLTNQASIKQALVLYQKHLKDVYGNALQSGSAEALILHALLSQASDIHLDVLPAGTRVRYRIGGVLHDAMRLTAEAGASLARGIKHIAKLFPIAVVQEGKFKIEKEHGETVVVSVANMPAVDGEKLTMRLAPEYMGSQGFTLSALGLHGKGLEQTHAMLGMHPGLVLVAGKSESGKTTTLYTLLDHIRGAHVAVATIEESIEHRLRTATQTQTRPELGLTMLAGLRAVLRTDPDAVLVGTLDSAETAQVALEAASRGVRVFAAIDARSSSGAIEKLLAWGLPPTLLASALRGVIGQTLVKKLPAEKGVGEKLSREESATLEPQANFGRVLAALKDEGQIENNVTWKDLPFYRGREDAGLVGIQEVLSITPTIKELIVQNADAEAIETQARKEGMLTLAEDSLFKAAQGLISIDSIIEAANE